MTAQTEPQEVQTIPEGTRAVLFSEELAAELFTRDADGRRLTVEWGEPDTDGFYTPTVTASEDDWFRAAGLGIAWQRAEDALPEYWAIRSLLLTPSGWQAVAYEGNQLRVGDGPTPTAALLDLAR
jgi:hypothetical protein